MFSLLRIALVVVLSLSFSCSLLAAQYKIASPNGRLVVTVTLDEGINYSAKLGDNALLNDAYADMSIQGLSSLAQANVIDENRQRVNRRITPPIKQKSAEIVEQYHELTLAFDNEQSISFRVFDEGFAYRFATTATGEIVVTDEQATMRFDDDHQVLFPQESSFISHNERLYLPKKLSQIESAQFASLPLLVDAGHSKLVITETGLRAYPGMWLAGGDNSNENPSASLSLNAIFPQHVLAAESKNGSDRNENILKRASYLAKNQLSENSNGRAFPWRVFAVSEQDAQLLTNQLTYLLADETAIDASWVKPGKVAWDWWNANNLYGVDFKAGINTQTYKHYIDFAAEFGLEYIILDEGWHHLDNVLSVVDEINVQEIIDYGKQKNVGVILWVIWRTLDQQLAPALDTFAKWGAAGIKVDFMQRDDQAMVDYYWKVAEEAAKRQLLVNFHGSYKPAGLRRTYPNVITREGVRGLEHNKWADYITSKHNLTLPFIRQLAGPMDYTPGAMVNSQPENFQVNFNRPMSKTTRAHQVALYVVFESPLQMLADSPSNYLKERETTEFISQIPTVWDETAVQSAKLGDHIIIARRSGDDWFIGVMGNAKVREFTIDLSFLGRGDYHMVSFNDGINAARYASDYRINVEQVSRKDRPSIVLAPNGGWAARLTRVK
ncbi:glycoside hydrolase family 97 protein [Thalassotalea fusca]